MSGHGRCVPEANLADHRTFCCLSLAACLVMCDRQTAHTLSESRCLACCQRIQLFAFALFHANAAVWQYPFTLVLISLTGQTLTPGVRPARLRSHGLFIASAWTFNHREMFECAHLKFTGSGQSKQPTSIHTCACAMQPH